MHGVSRLYDCCYIAWVSSLSIPPKPSNISATTTTATTRAGSVSEFSVQRDWHSDRRGPVRWLTSHIWRHKIWLLGILVGAIANGAGAALSPIFAGQAFDAIARPTPNLQALLVAAISIVISQVIRAMLQLMRNFSAEVIGQRLERDVRDELYASLIGKSMTFHDRQSIGDVMARATNDVREINFLMNPGVNLVIGSSMFMILPIVFVARLYPALLPVPIIYVIAYVVAVWLYLRELQPTTEAVRRNFGRMNSALAEAIEGVEVVKGAAREGHEIGRFKGLLKEWRNSTVKQGDVEARFIPLLLLGLTSAFGLIHSLLLFRAGQIQVGDVVSYNGMLLLFNFPTFAAQFAYSQMSSGVAGARRILELINTETKLDENVVGYDETMRGDVVFENVTFGYHSGDDKPALQEVNLTAKAGQTVAIVGQTGVGKSTITKLINRVYDVDQGQVLVDGVNVRDWNLATLRRQVSIIEQDIFLFSRTVADNIAFGMPDATQEQIERAARSAQAHDFIMSFKDGYKTVVGERGVTLSGGQRQRIAIARAFLTDPRILILDDSTSAIDSATEDLIQRAMIEAAKGRTTFLITHRLSQIRWADLIVVVKGGRVVASGAHDELINTSPAYRALFNH